MGEFLFSFRNQIFVITLTYSLTQRAYKIHLESVTVDLPEKDMVEIKVDLLNNSRGEQIMDVEYNIKKELTNLYVSFINRNCSI